MLCFFLKTKTYKLVYKTFVSLRCKNITAFILALPYFCCVSESKGRNTWDILRFHPIKKKKLDMIQEKTRLDLGNQAFFEVKSLIQDLEEGRTYTVRPMGAEKLPNGRQTITVYVYELGEFRTFPAGCFGKYIFTLGENFPKTNFKVVVSKSEMNGKIAKSWKVELA